MYRDVNKMMSETVILSAIQTSRIGVGNGKIKIAKIPTSAVGMSNPRIPPALIFSVPAIALAIIPV
jgi:hypothetical protein